MANSAFDIDQSSLSDRAYQVIKDLVLSGELKAGESISERSLATKFGLSRTPLREALRRLEQYGLVVSRPRSATQVASLAPAEAEDVSHVRAALEVAGVRLLIDRASDEDIDDLEALAGKCQTALDRGDIAETFERDSEFHIEIARRSKNRHLLDQYVRMDAKVQLLRLVLHLPPQYLRIFVSQHAPLLAAIRTRDTDRAVALMERHVMDQLQYQEARTAQA